jgi:tetratricopeptide (TPR) repeat protein
MTYKLLLLIGFAGILFACHKSDLLKKKSTTTLLVPTSPADMQGLLDNDAVFAPCTFLNFISADEFYFRDGYSSLSSSELGAYSWSDFNFGPDEDVPDWNNAYQQVYYCNTVLAGVSRLANNPGMGTDLNLLRGDALFKRAYAYYNLLQVFALPYDSATASADDGIVLRDDTDPNAHITRSSVYVSYDSVIADLTVACKLLPATVDYAHLNRSRQPAAFAMLARVYLSMGAFDKADSSASHSLALYDSLIDYNQVAQANYPFLVTNPETLYQSRMPSGNHLFDALAGQDAFIDSGLQHAYAAGDLRPLLFFRPRSGQQVTINGSYTGTIFPFSGLSTGELYLIRAECAARRGDTAAAFSFLNTLLRHRWQTGQFTPLTAGSASEALQVILTERKKELVFKGLRWTDIRRLNKKGAGIVLKRNVNGASYVIGPGSLRYALPIPDNVIRLNGITQNKR